MQYTELINNYTVAGDFSAVLICVSLFILIQKSLFFSSDRNFFLFKHANFLLMLGAMSNIAFAQLCMIDTEYVWAIYLTRDIYHICLMFSLLSFVIYVRNLVDADGLNKKLITYTVSIITGVGLVLDVISPLSKFGFYRSPDGLWTDSTYLKPYTIAYIATMVLISYMFIFYRRRIIYQIHGTLVMIEILCVAILLTENYFDSNTYTSITYIIPMIAVLVLVHSKPFSLLSGAMGADAFDSFLESAVKKRIVLDYMVLELYVDSSEDIPTELGKVLYNFWQTYFCNAVLFNLSTGLYVLAIPKSKKNRNSGENTRKLVNEIFPPYYEKFNIPYNIQVLLDVDFIKNQQAFLDAVKYSFSKMKRNEVKFVDEKEMSQLRKIQIVTDAIKDIDKKKDLTDPRILVFAQPVKNVKDDCFDTAEALMRMELPDIGMIFPDMFIPIAERTGSIHTLSCIIMNKTCRAIKELMDEHYIIKRISVNYSITELRSPTFSSELVDIISSNKIPYDRVAIELTESTNDDDFEIVFSRVNELKNYGICFYLDDFGTGYSNFDRILSLNLDIVKFDRSLLLLADEDKNVQFTFKHFSQAFEDLDYKILFEGVETANQENLCISCHADYLQGFKFSKPVPIHELRNFLTKETY